MEEIVIRDYLPFVDDAFIFDSWMRSYYGQSAATLYIPRVEFNLHQPKVIAKLLSRSQIKMAVKNDDNDLIIGYAVYEKPVNALHYIYVKEAFRGFGICRELIHQSGFAQGTKVTHLTMKGRSIALRRGFIYSPYFE